MIRLFFLLLVFPLSSYFESYCDLNDFDTHLIERAQILPVKGFNPSMVFFQDKILMVFRQEVKNISRVQYVFLDKRFHPLSKPKMLALKSKSPEDPRLLFVGEDLFLLFNDEKGGRQMFVAKLFFDGSELIADTPIHLKHPVKTQKIEKNWVPFDFEGDLFLGYTIAPHEVLHHDEVCAKTPFKHPYRWGELRGGTPALKIGEHYLAFFHSWQATYSNVSRGRRIPHYFFGTYLFSAEPPFAIQAMSPHPITGKGIYKKSSYNKRVVYPAGFLLRGDKVFVCCGRDDHSILILTMDLKKLMESLVDVAY